MVVVDWYKVLLVDGVAERRLTGARVPDNCTDERQSLVLDVQVEIDCVSASTSPASWWYLDGYQTPSGNHNDFIPKLALYGTRTY
jgi:hypothetical protein